MTTAMATEGFGQYELLERLGRGATAEVFLARSGQLERLVAIKRLRARFAGNPLAVSRFVANANLLARMQHANITPILDCGAVGGHCFIAMEPIHGRDLHAILRRHFALRKAVPVAAACAIAIELCSALDYVHRYTDYSGTSGDLVHGAVNLSNVMVSFDGAVKLLDVAAVPASAVTGNSEPGMGVQVWAYMSPEHQRGLPVDRRSDVYSCGRVLHDLIFGRRMGDAHAAVPAELQAILAKSLALYADDRYPSAQALQEALLGFALRSKQIVPRAHLSAWMRQLFASDHAVELRRHRALWKQAGEGASERRAGVSNHSSMGSVRGGAPDCSFPSSLAS